MKPGEYFLESTPVVANAGRKTATVLTERPDNKAMRRKSTEAPYYHRRTELPGQFAELFFERAPNVFICDHAADIER